MPETILRILVATIATSLLAALSGCVSRVQEPAPVYPVLRPVISEDAIPVESFTPEARDGQIGSAEKVRKTTGEAFRVVTVPADRKRAITKQLAAPSPRASSSASARSGTACSRIRASV